MAERSEKARERVREELQKNPGASTSELREAAQSVDPSVGELSLRQFNAGYVLPLKRSGVGGGGRKGRGGSRSASAAAAPKTRQRKQAEAPVAPAKRGGRRAPAAATSAPEGDRDRVRAALLEFARDFSDAKSRSEVVAVLSNVDQYVDRIVKARG